MLHPTSTFLVLLVLLSLLKPTTSLKSNGHHFNSDSWSFLTRFCFLPAGLTAASPENPTEAQKQDFGVMDFTLTYPKSSDTTLLMYFGSFEEFKTLYKSKQSELSCQDRIESAQFKFTLKKNTTVAVVGPSIIEELSETHETVKVDIFFINTQTYYFFIALANCEPVSDNATIALPIYTQSAVDVRYELLMTNGQDVNSRHFSADEIGVLDTTICFFCFQILLCIFAGSVVRRLNGLKKLHVTVKVFVFSVFVQMISIFLTLIYYITFSREGDAPLWLLITGNILTSCADASMVILLILLAKGWTIVRRKISIPGRIKLVVFSTTYFLSSITVIAWRYQDINPATTLYFYESNAGVFFIFVRYAAVVWFLYATKTTIKQFPGRKKRFYKRFTVLFTLWLVILPTAIIVCSFLPDWVRLKIVYAMSLTLLFLGQFSLCFMYHPNKLINSSFPFHDMSSGMMMESNGGVPKDEKKAGKKEQIINKLGLKPNDDPENGGGGRIVLESDNERVHVAELKNLNTFISKTVESLIAQQKELNRVLNDIDDGGESESASGVAGGTVTQRSSDRGHVLGGGGGGNSSSGEGRHSQRSSNGYHGAHGDGFNDFRGPSLTQLVERDERSDSHRSDANREYDRDRDRDRENNNLDTPDRNRGGGGGSGRAQGFDEWFDGTQNKIQIKGINEQKINGLPVQWNPESDREFDRDRNDRDRNDRDRNDRDRNDRSCNDRGRSDREVTKESLPHPLSNSNPNPPTSSHAPIYKSVSVMSRAPVVQTRREDVISDVEVMDLEQGGSGGGGGGWARDRGGSDDYGVDANSERGRDGKNKKKDKGGSRRDMMAPSVAPPMSEEKMSDYDEEKALGFRNADGDGDEPLVLGGDDDGEAGLRIKKKKKKKEKDRDKEGSGADSTPGTPTNAGKKKKKKKDGEEKDGDVNLDDAERKKKRKEKKLDRESSKRGDMV